MARRRAGGRRRVGGGPLRHVTTNVVLWPKLNVLSVNDEYLVVLSVQQRDWFRSAAQTAVTASLEGDYDESGYRRCSLHGGDAVPHGVRRRLQGAS